MTSKEADEEPAGKLHRLLRDHHAALDDAFGTSLPEGADFHYYRSFPDVKGKLSSWKGRLATLLEGCEAAVQKGKSTAAPGASRDLEDEDEVVEWVTSLLDDALHAVDCSLDEHRLRLRTAGEPLTASMAGSSSQPPAKRARLDPSAPVQQAATSVSRPQECFPQPVDNSNEPFVPRLDHLQLLMDADKALPVPSTEPPVKPQGAYQHPFHARLEAFAYLQHQLEAPAQPQLPSSMEQTPFTFVDTPEALQAMVVALDGVHEVAIDLEHHHFRSFNGFTCLMQLSSRTADWVVDTLALRGQLGAALGPLLANPGVVKVLHGADHDVLWLQKDFAVYVVNLFDTHQAARVLEYPGLGLAYLLKRHCNVKADKRYQLADWRIRPLTAEMLNYARCDTHYLLHIYDLLRTELLQQGSRVPESLQITIPDGRPGGALGTVLEASRQLCYQLYEKELFQEDGYLQVARRWRLTLSGAQLAAFAALFRWRDEVCRKEDESTGYILSRAQMTQVASSMPSTPAELKRAIGRASEPVTRNMAHLLALIHAAKANPLADALVQQLRTEDGDALNAAAASKSHTLGTATTTTSEEEAPATARSSVSAVIAPPAAAAGSSTSALPEAATIGKLPAEPVAKVVVPVRKTGSLFGRRAPAARMSAPAGIAAPAVATAEAQELDAAVAAAELLSGTLDTGSAAEGGATVGEQQAGGMHADEGRAGPEGDAQERCQLLKASFQLPWQQPGSDNQPAERAVADPMGVESTPGLRSTAADVRAAMQQLRSEDAEAGGPPADLPPAGVAAGSRPAAAAAAAEVHDEEYIPLPISEEYSKDGRKRGRDGQGTAVRRTMDEQQLAARYRGLGLPTAHQQHGAPAGVKAFDYEGARQEHEAQVAARKAQDRVLQDQEDLLQHGKGRGGRFGRGGRQQQHAGGRGPAVPRPEPGKAAAFNPHDIPDEHLVRAGKKSAAMPRSGNRSFSFK